MSCFFGLVVEIDDSTLTTKMQDLLRILLKITAAPYQTTGSVETRIEIFNVLIAWFVIKYVLLYML